MNFFQPSVKFLIFTVCGLSLQSAHGVPARFLTVSFYLAVLQGQYGFIVMWFEFLPGVENSCSAVLHVSFLNMYMFVLIVTLSP